MNRIKSMNESIYYNVDEIHRGIACDRTIRFRYFEYSAAKEKVYRHGGAWYEVSPYKLTWDDENYYMIAFDSPSGKIKHYRVDKMSDITMTDEPREGREAYEAADSARYPGMVFGMFSGEERTVRLRAANSLAGVIIDRFGKDVMIIPDTEGYFTVQAEVVVSPQFYGWVSSFGDGMVITAPGDVVDGMRRHISSIAGCY
jgi:predicted DNA-binding transcriptional regulator YafY